MPLPLLTEFIISQPPSAQPAVLDRRLIVILLIVFVQFFGASMVLPILPLYAKNRFDVSLEAVTLLNASFFAAQFIAAPFIGRLSDRYGRVPVLVISQVGTAISYLMLAFAQTSSVLFLARVLDGITGGNLIVAQAYVTDVTPREKRTQALGYVLAALSSGFIFGPAVGGVAAGLFTYETPFLVASFVALLVSILTWRVLDESLSSEQRDYNRMHKAKPLNLRNVLMNFPLVGILLVTFGAQFAFAMLQNTFSLYGEAVIFAATPEFVELGVGLLLACIGIGQIFTQLFLIRRLVAWFGEAALVVIGGIGRMISLALLVISPSLFAVVPAFLFFAIGTGAQMPALQTLVTNTVDDTQRGAALGLYQSAFSLAIIIGSAISGTLFAFAPTMPYIVGTVVFAIMLIPSVGLMNWARRHPIEPTPTAVVAGD